LVVQVSPVSAADEETGRGHVDRRAAHARRIREHGRKTGKQGCARLAITRQPARGLFTGRPGNGLKYARN
jgi:hypothetical protein